MNMYNFANVAFETELVLDFNLTVGKLVSVLFTANGMVNMYKFNNLSF